MDYIRMLFIAAPEQEGYLEIKRCKKFTSALSYLFIQQTLDAPEILSKPWEYTNDMDTSLLLKKLWE
jgi:hypothetical protein